MLPNLLTEKECAVLLRIKAQTLRMWRSSYGGKGLPWITVGRSIRYDSSAVQAYLQSQTKGTVC